MQKAAGESPTARPPRGGGRHTGHTQGGLGANTPFESRHQSPESKAKWQACSPQRLPSPPAPTLSGFPTGASGHT